MDNGKLRIDKYLWAIRIFKTRTQAADAIAAGKVKSNGLDIKSGKHVTIGDHYEIKTEARKWVIEVTGLLHQRVQYSEAINFYIDLTPEEDLVKKSESAFIEYTGKRQHQRAPKSKYGVGFDRRVAALSCRSRAYSKDDIGTILKR